MARKKISAMTAASAYTGANEFYELVQGGNTKQGSHALLKTYFDTLYAPAVKYAKLSHTLAANTAGGTFTTGTQTRPINLKNSDVSGIVTLSSNEMTLQSGTYRARAWSGCYAVDAHQAFLYNVTDAVVQNDVGGNPIVGSSETALSTSSHTANSRFEGEFTIASAKAFTIRHTASSTRATDGFGRPANLGNSECYAVIEFWKVA